MSWRTVLKLKTILKEDDFEDKFEKVPFGYDDEIRAMIKGNPPHEKNTDFERELLSLLRKWTVGLDLTTVGKRMLDELDIIKEGARKFPEIFKPETSNGTALYRGLRFLSPSVEEELLKKQQSDFTEITVGGSTYWKCNTPINYKARTPVQSWTSSESVPQKFSRKSGVLIMTVQDNDFYFNQKFLNLLFQKMNTGEMTDEENESETLHFGHNYKSDVFILISDMHYRRKFIDGDNN